MRLPGLRWFFVLGWLSCAAAAAQDSASVALEECAAQFDEPHEMGEAPGFAEIGTGCPQLKTILENSPYAAWLPEEWWGPMLTPESLRQLGELIAREPVATSTWKADTSGVAPALATLGEGAEAEVTWWDRVREWLRNRMQADSDGPPQWLIEWLEKLDQQERVLRIVGYTVFVLIVLAAGWIVVNELRASGAFGSRSRQLSRSGAARDAQRAGAALRLADLERTDPANRPSMLLALLLGAVARRQDRAIDLSFTHRELASRVDLENDWQRAAFGQLLRCAERVRYAPELPARLEIDDAVLSGRRLLESISAPAGVAAT